MNRTGWFLAAAALCCFSWRLFYPPLIGLANNGDFGKIAGPFRLGPASGVSDDRFFFVTRDYKRAPEYIWDSHYRSSESLFALAAYELSRVFQRRDQFDIRWMGLVHLAVIMMAFVWLMAALRPLGTAAQFAAGLAVIAILSDAAYLAYCNSFFTDAAALAGALLVTAVLVDLAVRGSSTPRLAGFVLGALLLESSKTQHVLLALPLAILVWLVARNRRAIAAGAIVLAGGIVFIAVSPANYRADPIFNLIFYKLTPQSAAPLDDLTALGPGAEDLRYVGMHAYMPGSLTSNYDAALEFVHRVSMGRLARFYLSHPKSTGAILWRDLVENASLIQVEELGNYTADSGLAPHSHAPAYWTDARSKLLQRAPWLAPLWLVLTATVCLVVRSRTAWVCLGVIAMAAIEFVVASLGDALDTSRHLLLFQVMVEVTICFAITAAARAFKPVSVRVHRWLPAARAWKPA
jgi:hypothetical protein